LLADWKCYTVRENWSRAENRATLAVRQTTPDTCSCFASLAGGQGVRANYCALHSSSLASNKLAGKVSRVTLVSTRKGLAEEQRATLANRSLSPFIAVR